MGIVRSPKPVQFFASIIFSDDEHLHSVESDIRKVIGDIQDKTAFEPFLQTDYYEKEMGGDLSRVFILFSPLLQRETLPEVKLKTNDIETSFAPVGKRAVNIDPGYIALEHVILATTKGYAHRIYLGGGIYADLTLIYRNGTYRALEWTYPDYGSEEIVTVFNRWRGSLKEKMRR